MKHASKINPEEETKDEKSLGIADLCKTMKDSAGASIDDLLRTIFGFELQNQQQSSVESSQEPQQQLSLNNKCTDKQLKQQQKRLQIVQDKILNELECKHHLYCTNLFKMADVDEDMTRDEKALHKLINYQ